jgi:hypothetical protein
MLNLALNVVDWHILYHYFGNPNVNQENSFRGKEVVSRQCLLKCGFTHGLAPVILLLL